MSFLLPSLPTFASRASSYLHPHHSEPEPPKLHISVTPLQPSTFAGEVFQAKISFRVSQPEPTTSTQPPFLHPSSSTANGISPFAPEQTVFTTPGRPFAPSHRVAQSLSIRGIEGGSRLPQTAGPVLEASSSPSNGQPSSLGYPSLMSLEKHGSQEFPPRRGQVGKQPRPKLAALRRVSHQEGHARQRSASGSDLPVLGERRGTEPVVESPVARDKGKGRAPATGGRSQSMSGPLNGMGNYRPPPREERAVATSEYHFVNSGDGRISKLTRPNCIRLSDANADSFDPLLPLDPSFARHSSLHPRIPSSRSETLVHARLFLRIIVLLAVTRPSPRRLPSTWRLHYPLRIYLPFLLPGFRTQLHLRVTHHWLGDSPAQRDADVGTRRLVRSRSRRQPAAVRRSRRSVHGLSISTSAANSKFHRPRTTTILPQPLPLVVRVSSTAASPF